MSLFGRWTDEKKEIGYWKPLASLGAWATAMQAEIQLLRVPDVSVSVSSSNPNEWVTGLAGSNLTKVSAPVTSLLSQLQQRTAAIAQLRQIQSRVMAEIHSFAVRTYHRLAFQNVAESIFNDYQRRIDSLLSSGASDVVEKIPSITARLVEGDAEAVSQALNSCRRMIKAFADAVQPAENMEVELDNEKYGIGSDKVLNRIQYFLAQQCSRRDAVID